MNAPTWPTLLAHCPALDPTTTTLAELLDRLQHQLGDARAALTAEAVIPAQAALEDALLVLLALLQRQNVDIEAGLTRALARQSSPQSASRVLRVYPDRAEWWVGSEYRGGWPLFSPEDCRACQRLAAELGCQLEITAEAAQQLQLFPSS